MVLGIQFYADILASFTMCGNTDGTGTGERVKH
jgi:hypothetical protein